MPSFYGCQCDECLLAVKRASFELAHLKWVKEQFENEVSLRILYASEISGEYCHYSTTWVPSFFEEYFLCLVSHDYARECMSVEATCYSYSRSNVHTGFLYLIVPRSSLRYERDIRFDGQSYFLIERTQEECHVCKKKSSGVVAFGNFKVHRSCVQSHQYGGGNKKNIYTSEKLKLPTFSVEFEMEAPSLIAAHQRYESCIVELILRDFRRTTDGTVSDELVSPIYHSDRTFLQALPQLDIGSEWVGSECGTHLHVGITDSAKSFYRRNQDVFDQLGSYLERSPYTEHVWGRYPNTWCKAIQDDDRYCWVNIGTEHPTIEFRLPKYRDARQYRRLVLFLREFTRELEKISHLNNSNVWRFERISDEIFTHYRHFEMYSMKGVCHV